MTTDNFCFYLQNRLIQTSQTGDQWYSDTSPLVFPGETYYRTPPNYLRVASLSIRLPTTNTLAYYDKESSITAVKVLLKRPLEKNETTKLKNIFKKYFLPS